MPNDGNDVIICAHCEIPADYVAKADTVSIPYYDTIFVKDGGQLFHSNAGVTATVQKNVSKYTVAQTSGETMANGWYFIASPVSTSYTPDTTMLSSTYDLYRLNNTTWENWKKEGDHYHFNLENSHGYLYANSEDVTLEFTGTVLPSAASQEVSVSAGFNLIGTPFLYNVYANRVYYKMNDERTGVEAVENYQANPIAPCTGIIIDADAAGTVAFTKEAPSLSNHNGSLQIALCQVPEPVEGPACKGNGVSTSSTTLALDNAIVSFNEGNELEKFHFGNNAKLYIPQDGKDYAIAFSDRAGEVPLNFKATENGTYTIMVNPEGVEMNYLHLIDNMTGEDIDLLINPSYTFEARTTDYESRFKLVFASDNEDGSSTGSEAFAFYSNGNWVIANEGEATLQVIDMMGRILSSETISGSVSKAIDVAPGVYILKLNDKVQKIVVR